jgi:hypothetical protein
LEHGLDGPAWAALLEQSSLGATLRSSIWLYPAVECLHIVGFALLVGSIVSFDVRSLRARSLETVETLAAQLLPVARTGFALAVPMGLLLFTTEATAYLANPLFLAKLVLIALSLANIAWFHHRLRAASHTFGVIGMGRLRLSAGISLGLWICVLLAGRLIAYV